MNDIRKVCKNLGWTNFVSIHSNAVLLTTSHVVFLGRKGRGLGYGIKGPGTMVGWTYVCGVGSMGVGKICRGSWDDGWVDFKKYLFTLSSMEINGPIKLRQLVFSIVFCLPPFQLSPIVTLDAILQYFLPTKRTVLPDFPFLLP